MFEAVCRHSSNKAAAMELGVSVQTVKNTLSGVYAKLGTHSVGETAYRLWFLPRNTLADLKDRVLKVGDTPQGQNAWMAIAAIVGLITEAEQSVGLRTDDEPVLTLVEGLGDRRHG